VNFRQKKNKELEISLTPMIDVVFLLLIFFMVTTTFNKQTEIKISLPEAQGETAQSDNKTLRLTIDVDGKYYVNNKQLLNQQLTTLQKALIEAAGDNRELPFIISADAQTAHQAVISALDIAAKSGFTKITFATKLSSTQK